jgi:hypothetical protein
VGCRLRDEDQSEFRDWRFWSKSRVTPLQGLGWLWGRLTWAYALHAPAQAITLRAFGPGGAKELESRPLDEAKVMHQGVSVTLLRTRRAFVRAARPTGTNGERDWGALTQGIGLAASALG